MYNDRSGAGEGVGWGPDRGGGGENDFCEMGGKEKWNKMRCAA